jgi:hypothetical protein
MPTRRRPDEEIDYVNRLCYMNINLDGLSTMEKPEQVEKLYLFALTGDMGYKVKNLPENISFVLKALKEGLYHLVPIKEKMVNVNPDRIWGSIFLGSMPVSFSMPITGLWGIGREADNLGMVSVAAEVNHICYEWLQSKIKEYKTIIASGVTPPATEAPSPRPLLDLVESHFDEEFREVSHEDGDELEHEAQSRYSDLISETARRTMFTRPLSYEPSSWSATTFAASSTTNTTNIDVV